MSAFIESLEERKLFAAAASLTSRGTLLVAGTKGVDRISIDLLGSDILVRQRIADPFVSKVYVTLLSIDRNQVRRIYVDCGAGDDRISIDTPIPGKPNTLIGGSGNDLISGNVAGGILRGGAGDDIVGGAGGDYLITGDDGDDIISAAKGNDTLIAGRGNDFLFGGEGVDSLRGGAGDDVLTGGLGDDTFRGNEGDDYLRDEDTPYPTGLNDLYDGGPGHDIAELPALGRHIRIEELLPPPDRE